MTTSPSTVTPSPSRSSGDSFASLPRWRQWLSRLNWHRDPGYEQRVLLHKERMKQLENDILRVRSETEQIKKEAEQIERETEQLRRENARERALSALIKQHCFPPASCSNPPPSIAPDSSCS